MIDLKNNYVFTTAITCLLFAISLTDVTAQKQKVEGVFFTQQNHQFHFTQDEIKIAKSGENIFSKSFSGRKIFHFSPDKEFLLICNFSFPVRKENYNIEIFLFDKNYELINQKKLEAFYDMPHQIFAVNDEGIIAAYDPASMNLLLIDGDKQSNVKLEENINYEMERAAFINFSVEGLYIATNLKPVLMENYQPNCVIYKVDLGSNTFIKSMVNLSIFSAMNLCDEKIYLSGIRVENANSLQKTFIFDSNLNQSSELNLNVLSAFKLDEKIYLRTDEKIFEANEQTEEIKDFTSLGRSFPHAAAKNGPPLWLLTKEDKFAVASMITKAEKRIDINLLSSYFESDFINGFLYDNNVCYLFTNKETILIQNENINEEHK